jgi:hypothetical protein
MSIVVAYVRIALPELQHLHFQFLDRDTFSGCIVQVKYKIMKSKIKGANAICWNDEDCVRLLPSCSHYFHLDCIDQWLPYQATCPLCRGSTRRNTHGRSERSLLSIHTVKLTKPVLLVCGFGNCSIAVDYFVQYGFATEVLILSVE